MTKKIWWRWIVWLWRTLKHDAVLMYRAFIHPEVSIALKLAMIWIIVYAVAPIDILPDWILWFWIIDDVWIIILVVKRIIKQLPSKIKDELEWKIIVMDKK